MFANVLYAVNETSWCAVVAFCVAAAFVLITLVLLYLRAQNACTHTLTSPYPATMSCCITVYRYRLVFMLSLTRITVYRYYVPSDCWLLFTLSLTMLNHAVCAAWDVQ